MNKKILFVCVLIVLLIVGLLIFTGGGSKEKVQNSENEQQTEPIVDESLIKINNLEFHLDKETSFKDINYTIVGDFKEANYNKYIQYNYYQEDNTNLLYFRIFYYGKLTNDDAIKDLGIGDNITLTDGKTDKIEYKYYDDQRDDGGSMHFYFINNDGNLYVLNFVSKYDIKDFEEKVINSVKF